MSAASNNVFFATDLQLQVAAGQNGNGVAMPVGGAGTVTIEVSGTFSLQIVPEVNVDGVWQPTLAVNLSSGVVTAGLITAAGVYLIPLPGGDQFRARVQNAASGNVTVTAKAVSGSPGIMVVVGTPGGTPVPVNLNQVGNQTLAIGQQSMQGSVPVVIASNQSNLPTTGPQDVTAAVSISTANTPSTVLNCAGLQSVSAVLTGIWVATVVPQVSVDGARWDNTQFYNPTTQTFSATATAPGTYQVVGKGGAYQVRLSTTLYTSGTVAGTLRASSQQDDTVTAQLSATGQTARATAATVVLAYDTYAWPGQLNANAVTTALQGGGGYGPVVPAPTGDDRVLNQMQLLCDIGRQLLEAVLNLASP